MLNTGIGSSIASSNTTTGDSSLYIGYNNGYSNNTFKPSLLDLVSVQPMKPPSTGLFYFDFIYKNSNNMNFTYQTADLNNNPIGKCPRTGKEAPKVSKNSLIKLVINAEKIKMLRLKGEAIELHELIKFELKNNLTSDNARQFNDRLTKVLSDIKSIKLFIKIKKNQLK